MVRDREKEWKVWQSSWKYNKHECRTPVLGGFKETVWLPGFFRI